MVLKEPKTAKILGSGYGRVNKGYRGKLWTKPSNGEFIARNKSQLALKKKNEVLNLISAPRAAYNKIQAERNKIRQLVQSSDAYGNLQI